MAVSAPRPLRGPQGQPMLQGPCGVGRSLLRPTLQTGCSGLLPSKLSHGFRPDEFSALLLHPLPTGPQRSCLPHLPHLILPTTCHATPSPSLPRSCLSSSFSFGAFEGSRLVQRIHRWMRGLASLGASCLVPEIGPLAPLCLIVMICITGLR